MQAIVTKYHGPTDHKGARISATAEAGRVVVAYDYSKNGEENHYFAALALIERLGWSHLMERCDIWNGGLPDGKSRAHVFIYKSR
jgi:hypothetical protein